MTFFDITLAGALVNALEAAAESQRSVDKAKKVALSKSKRGRISFEWLFPHFQKLLTLLQRREARIS